MKEKQIDVCLIGHDVQPSMAFTDLGRELCTRGLRVLTGVMSGKDRQQVGANLVQASRCVVIGMSSSPQWAQVEVAAAQAAMEADVPFGFYSDIFRCHRRAWFEPFRAKASFVFAFNQAEVSDAQSYFPKAKIVATGNPTHVSYFTRSMSAEDVEKIIAADSDAFVVFVSCSKHLKITLELLDAAVAACGGLDRVRIVAGLHPGDQNPVEAYMAHAAEMGAQVTFVTKKELTGPQALCRANLLIESTGSLGIEAACKRIPVVNFLTPTSLELLVQETGAPEWPPCMHGTSIRVDNDPQRLRDYVVLLHSGQKLPDLTRRQEEIYPQPAIPGSSQSIKIMADTVGQLLER